MDTKILQEILGHSNISHTLGVYTHVLHDTKKAAMESFNKDLENIKHLLKP